MILSTSSKTDFKRGRAELASLRADLLIVADRFSIALGNGGSMIALRCGRASWSSAARQPEASGEPCPPPPPAPSLCVLAPVQGAGLYVPLMPLLNLP